jgi:methoxymalonate biosynthesis acyl carrier protein
METEIKTKTRQFLAQRFRNYDLQDDEDIFTLGFVNSLFAMQLIVFVEEEFQIAVDDQDLDIDNFRSINALASLVLRKKGAK